MSSSSFQASPGLLVPAAQVVGITTSAFLTGFGFAFSHVSIPVIQQTCPPELLAKQWLLTFEIGKAAAPPLAVASAICFGFLASRSTDRKGFFPDMTFDPTAPWALYTAAAVLVPSIVPYTLLVMKPTTLEPLIAAAANPSILSTERTLELLQEWKVQNIIRSSFGAIGSLCAAVATVAL